MKIGILGAGHIGATVGRLWASAGHLVRFSATDVESLGQLLKETGPATSAGTPSEAVKFGEAVLVALPAPVVVEVLSACGPLDGKVVIHAANGFGRGALPLAAMEKRFPAGRWVRAYNTLQARVLQQDNHREERYALLLSGDDAAAREVVAGLIRASGFAPVDVGGGADSALQDPGSPLWNNVLTEAQAVAALTELRTTGHTSTDPIAEAVTVLAERGSDDGAWWLEQVTRTVFRAGMSWRVVESKWEGFRADFHDFDPAAVAAMDDAELARVESDPQVIRNVRKLKATVANGRAMQDLLAQHRGFRAYLSSFPEPSEAAPDLVRRFKFLGSSGAASLLLSAARSAA